MSSIVRLSIRVEFDCIWIKIVWPTKPNWKISWLTGWSLAAQFAAFIPNEAKFISHFGQQIKQQAYGNFVVLVRPSVTNNLAPAMHQFQNLKMPVFVWWSYIVANYSNQTTQTCLAEANWAKLYKKYRYSSVSPLVDRKHLPCDCARGRGGGGGRIRCNESAIG